MKEIKVLIQQLREYPNNSFVYGYEELPEISRHFGISGKGLVVCDVNGEQQGFIETGGKGEVVIEA